ncbi:hypothetical protein MSPP1_001823 [Malassezia sp. CBS 17886]|nr:hypothetical protein MSPP1_001823 [Malassezia sp. CBS 17886]
MAAPPLFDGVDAALAQCVDAHESDALRDMLRAHGAALWEGPLPHALPDAGTHAQLRHPTHIVTPTSRCAELLAYEHASVAPPVAVTPAWVRRSVALGLPQAADTYSPDPTKIFSGVIVSCSGLSPHDEEVLTTTVASLGGGVRTSLTRDVTHVLATSREGAKVAALEEHPDVGIHVVAPHWISDSSSLQRVLSLDEYAFPLLEPGKLPLCLRATHERPIRPVADTDEAPPVVSVSCAALARNAVLFARDVHGGSMEAAPELRLLQNRVRQAGGSCLPALAADAPDADVFSAVRAADIVVARYRQGAEYEEAMRRGIPIGTLAWLSEVLVSGTLTPPPDRLLHFPYPTEPVPGFPSMSVSLTNYTGAKRRYLRDLITKMGATYTPELTRANSVCVALDLAGDKVSMAREWNIPIVNHTWVEACFATWTNQNLAQRSFITFPGAATLAATVGVAGVADECLLVGEGRESRGAADARARAAIQRHGAGTASSERGNGSDGMAPQTHDAWMRESCPPSPRPPRGCSVQSESDGVPAPSHKREDVSWAAHQSRDASAAPTETSDSGSEYATRTSLGPRTGFPRGVVPCGDHAAHQLKTARRRKVSPDVAQISIATTSVNLSARECEVLDALHVARTDDMSVATHLVAARLTRTEKMLRAIASGTVAVVGVQWVKDMVKRRTVLDTSTYMLHDAAKEKQFGIQLADVLARSRAAPGALFRGHTFYVTRAVAPSRDILRRVIQAAGGAAADVPQNVVVVDDTHHVIACVEDAQAVATLRAQTKKEWTAWTPEVVLSSVMRQVPTWAPEYVLEL